MGAFSLTLSVSEDAHFLFNLKKVVKPGRYLVIFQNNTELRPTGGFIGSFMTVDISNLGYKVVEFEGNIHRRDTTFVRNHKVEAPAPLNEIYDNWAMRGANWHPDFRESAKQILWFFEREGGYPVDGVIALNATVARDFLKVLGPIKTESGFEASFNNFLPSLQQEVERNYYRQEANIVENESKSIIKDLMTEMIKKVSQPQNAVRVGKLIKNQIEEKHILFYSTDPIHEQYIESLGWSGRLEPVKVDYLLINNAGIIRSQYLPLIQNQELSSKSSLNVGQKTFLELTKDNDYLKHDLTIERIHTGNGEWPDFHNFNFSRIIVPKDAQIVKITYNGKDVSDSEIIKEDFGDKKSYGVDFNTNIGETSQLKVEYLTPFTDNWQFIYEKQPGVLNEYLRVDYQGKNIFDGSVVKNINLKSN